jgi:hypothetical protein
MTDEATAQGVQQNKALKKKILDRHRPAFDLWLRLAQILEEAVVKERKLDSAYARALDLFFIEAFKSHQSLYSLCVMGHCEDAATIARRLLEIALQVGYLCSEESKREERGQAYLAYFWHNAKEILVTTNLPDEQRQWWEKQYDRHKKFLTFDSKGRPSKSWSGLTFAQLAESLGRRDTYDKDYALLSNVAHCSSRGLLLGKTNNIIEIKSDRFVSPILVYGTKYTIWVAANWNETLALIDAASLEKLRDDAVNFTFKEPVK